MRESYDEPDCDAWQINEGSGTIRSFQDLECWKACRELRIFVSRELLPKLPGEERYRLGDQLIRSARSTTSNIAEGFGRIHHFDNARFCSNSRGSCWEVLDHLITAEDEALLPRDLIAHARERVQRAVRLLNGYIRYLQQAPTKLPNSRQSKRA